MVWHQVHHWSGFQNRAECLEAALIMMSPVSMKAQHEHGSWNVLLNSVAVIAVLVQCCLQHRGSDASDGSDLSNVVNVNLHHDSQCARITSPLT